MIRRLVLAIVVSILLVSPAFANEAANVPFLTWENGKTHSVILGGPSSDASWVIVLEGSGTESLEFSKSDRNSEGFYLYTIDLPKDLEPGGYIVSATDRNGSRRVVAGVEVKERESYRIAEIPTDLRLLAIIFAGLTAIFTAVRSQKYANLSFKQSSIESSSWLYRLRRERLSSSGNSIARFVIEHSGEALHRISPQLWSLFPWLVIPLGIYTALQIQLDGAIPNGPVILFFICAAIGALDATAGITLALSLGFMHVAFGNVTDVRSLVVVGAFTLAWYLPAILASLLRLTLPQDLSRFSVRVNVLLSSFLAAIAGGFTLVLSVILTDSLVINREASELLRWPLAAVVSVVIFLKFSISEVVRVEDPQEVRLYLARVVSPGLATTLFFGTLLLVYTWTNDLTATVIATLVISTPYFSLFVVFPRLARAAVLKLPRSLLIESLIVTSLTYGVYLALASAPLAVIDKSRAFILLGLVPSLLHALYSMVIASGEHLDRKRDEEAVR